MHHASNSPIAEAKAVARPGSPPSPPEPDSPVSISCFDSIPAFVEAELDQLYQQLISSMSHYEFRRRAKDASVYVARRGSRTVAIFLLKREKHKISVLNELIQIDREEIERFAKYIFDRYASVSVICFSLIGKGIGPLSLPHQQHGHSEDIVVDLPETPEAYQCSLSSSTRYSIKRHFKAIARDHPALQFKTYEDDGIRKQDIDELIELKKANFEERRIKFGMTRQETEWLAERVKTGGLLTVATVENKICAGTLSLRVCDNYFVHVLAYDTGFARYGIGTLCCYLTMNEIILRGAREAHFCWGRNQYKYKLSGVQHDMANLDIYRSRAQYVRNLIAVTTNAARTGFQQFKIKLLDCEHRRGTLPWVARAVVGSLRRIKRSTYVWTSVRADVSD